MATIPEGATATLADMVVNARRNWTDAPWLCTNYANRLVVYQLCATDDVYNGDRGGRKRPNPVLWSEFRAPDSPQWGRDWGQGSEATLGAGVEAGSEPWAAAVPLDRVSGSCGQNAEWVFVNRYHSFHII